MVQNSVAAINNLSGKIVRWFETPHQRRTREDREEEDIAVAKAIVDAAAQALVDAEADRVRNLPGGIVEQQKVEDCITYNQKIDIVSSTSLKELIQMKLNWESDNFKLLVTNTRNDFAEICLTQNIKLLIEFDEVGRNQDHIETTLAEMVNTIVYLPGHCTGKSHFMIQRVLLDPFTDTYEDDCVNNLVDQNNSMVDVGSSYMKAYYKKEGYSVTEQNKMKSENYIEAKNKFQTDMQLRMIKMGLETVPLLSEPTNTCDVVRSYKFTITGFFLDINGQPAELGDFNLVRSKSAWYDACLTLNTSEEFGSESNESYVEQFGSESNESYVEQFGSEGNNKSVKLLFIIIPIILIILAIIYLLVIKNKGSKNLMKFKRR